MTARTATTEGPLGFPQTDRQAKAVEAILKRLPHDQAFAYRRIASENLVKVDLQVGERADISWISTQDPDRGGDVVLAHGMDDSQFALNPIVTLQHDYNLPPVGKSLWRKRVRDGERQGIKAKTHYPERPAPWTNDDWPPDRAFALVQADLLRGKSIGYLPKRVHVPTEAERQRRGWERVELVIDEWLLLEYACVFLPAQHNAVVEAVSKRGQLFGDAPVSSASEVSFVALSEVGRMLESSFGRIDVHAICRNRLDLARGRV